MKKQKKHICLKSVFVMICISMLLFSCSKKGDSEDSDTTEEIKGSPGNPRFNLQFTNGTKTDLDLHVLTPNGSEIYYANPSAQSGELDVDCLCGDCPNGPNENIYWQSGAAPTGTYKVWVEYYDACDASMSSSTFTLRILKNSEVLKTYTGTLSPSNTKSTVYTVAFDGTSPRVTSSVPYQNENLIIKTLNSEKVNLKIKHFLK
ncbi:MAG: hypothetical protein DI598_03150 [Pseudopedobacter saltans]|uniref:Uncharacterized protein n=1 Tax=Pseudopedobacter saltans TaxID=151895 RepID=A0A2W5HCP4_9SPHI|nr:MAG: hypothetical protein DI598_03150 [Pseudopedobacter saltans]